MRTAPLAVFTFRRPDHTERLFRSLLANPEIGATAVYVFSDAPKTGRDAAFVEATRAVVRRSGLPRLTVVEREHNYGLAANVIDGVTRLCSEHGQAIVLEDDLLVSSTFLAYMNAALQRYAGARQVMHISAYMYPIRLRSKADVIFMPFINSWGWATWARAWQHFDFEARGYDELRVDPARRRLFDLDGSYYFYHMLESFMAGKIDSWAIRWYLSVFMNSGLSLFPARSLIQNTGFGEGASNIVDEPTRQYLAKAHPFQVHDFPGPTVDADAFQRVKRYLGRELSFPFRAERKARSLMRRTLSALRGLRRAPSRSRR